MGIDLCELRRAIQVITASATKLGLSTASVLLRLDGHDARRCSALRCVGCQSRGDCFARRDYRLLDLEVVKQALAQAPDHVSTHPESGMTRALYDCPAVPLTPAGPEVRLVVASHAVTTSPRHPSVSSGTAWSTNCLSARFPRPRLPPRMCSTSRLPSRIV